jgi:hypothetical protein
VERNITGQVDFRPAPEVQMFDVMTLLPKASLHTKLGMMVICAHLSTGLDRSSMEKYFLNVRKIKFSY